MSSKIIDDADAIMILGEANVVTSRQARLVFGVSSSEVVDILPFTRITVEQCATQNERGEADWRLIFDLGTPLIELQERFGTRRNGRPHFCGNRWWLKPGNDWASEPRRPQFHLLNFRRQHTSVRWEHQPDQCAEGVVRADETVITAACFANHVTHNGERLLGEWYHWGKTPIRNESHVAVGGFDSHGFFIWHKPDDSPQLDVGMVEELLPNI